MEKDVASGVGIGREAVLDPACWLRCDRCRKWRLVHKNCLRSFRAECHFREERTDWDWVWWLQQAPARYESFLKRHMGVVGASEQSRLKGVLQSNADAAGEAGDGDVAAES